VKEPSVREIDVRTFRRSLGAMLDVYSAAMAPPDDQIPSRHMIMQRHATYPGFRAFLAERRRPLGTSIVGFIYGSTVSREARASGGTTSWTRSYVFGWDES
jgi:hypothetical protein